MSGFGDPLSKKLTVDGHWLVTSGAPRHRVLEMTDEDVAKISNLPEWFLGWDGLYIMGANDSRFLSDRNREIRLVRFFKAVGVQLSFAH